MTITIDGKKVEVTPGEMILSVARRVGIEIPALCADPYLSPFDSCGVCVVEVEGKGVVKSCSTPVVDGMVIWTKSEKAEGVRRTALQLLLSAHWGDCIAPCQLACPAHTDCQGYVGLTANGMYFEALKLLYERLPLPATLGRICPAPCEDACRRTIIEAPIQIRRIKRLLGDLKLDYVPPVGEETGFEVGVVGSGPAGLSAAYFLRRLGHGVVIFEAEEKLGGMLRYGIPAFRLPDEVLDREIDVLSRMGIEFRTGIRLGREISLTQLEDGFDAVFLGLGAWKSRRLGIPSEDNPAVWLGIEFLRAVKEGRRPKLPGKVAVIGGGNTAIDAARTARRLGAEVVVLYRRGREEMPAAPEEVKEAEEEGVRFEFLTQPVDFLPADCKLEGVRCIRMQLTEPDSSGRRRPLPIPGSEFQVAVEGAIVAVGQVPDASFLTETGLELARNGTLIAGPDAGQTSRPKVFAGGDLVTGPGIAIEAIAAGRRSALAIDRFLRGLDLKEPEPYVHEKDGVQREDLGEVEEAPRIQPRVRPPEERVRDFKPFEKAFTRTEARAEANRCLECGCSAAFSCLLRDYSSQVQALHDRYKGEVIKPLPDRRHPFIVRDPGKCVVCGRCVRVCADICGIHAIDFTGRGFVTEIQTPFNIAWQDSDCVSCGACVDTCPTGALTDRAALDKQVPLRTVRKETVCTLCNLACPIVVETINGRFLRVVAPEGAVLCAQGRYGWQVLVQQHRIARPYLRKNGRLHPLDLEKSFRWLKERLPERDVVMQLDGALALEEAALWTELARSTFDHVIVGVGRDAQRSSFPLKRYVGAEALEEADVIVSVGPTSKLAGFGLNIRLKQALRRDASVLSLSRGFPDGERIPWTDRGRARLKTILGKAERPVLTVEERWSTERSWAMITALLAEYPQLGLFLLQSNTNLGGLLGLGAEPGLPPKAAEAYITVGIDLARDPAWAERLAKARLTVAITPWLTKTARQADLILPMALPLEAGGTFQPLGGRPSICSPVAVSPLGLSNIEILTGLARALDLPLRLREAAFANPRDLDEVPVLSPASGTALAGRILSRLGIKSR